MCSTSDAPKTALSASEESSAAKCSPAACAQQQSTEMCQQRPTANSIPAQLPPAPQPPAPQPPAPQFVAPSPCCTGRTIADQQAPAADSVIAPAAVTIFIASSRNEVAAAPKIPAHLPFVSGPKQPPVLAGPVSTSVPPRTAAQMASSRNEFAAVPNIPAHVPFMSGPKQSLVLAEPVLTSVPPGTAAQMARGGQNRSRCAMEVMS